MAGRGKLISSIPRLSKRITYNVFSIGIFSQDLQCKIADRPIIFFEYEPESIPIPITEEKEPIIAINSYIQIAKV